MFLGFVHPKSTGKKATVQLQSSGTNKFLITSNTFRLFPPDLIPETKKKQQISGQAIGTLEQPQLLVWFFPHRSLIIRPSVEYRPAAVAF